MSEWKETELGKIPHHWSIKTVKELIQEKIICKPKDGNHGGKHPKGEDFIKNGIPFIMATDVNNGKIDLLNCKFISKERADKLDKGFSLEGDILLTHKASLGRTAIVKNLNTPYIMLTPQVTYYRIANKDKLDNLFLKLFFDSPVFQDTLTNHGDSGSTRAYVGIIAQQDLPIVFPPIEEQKAIASVLSSLDDKIDLLHRQNKTLEAMAETLFRQWFVEEADADWVYDELKNYVDIVDNRGKTPPNSDICSDYPLIEANALNGEDRLVNYSVIKKYVTMQTFKTWFRDSLTKYDSLITTVGANIGAMSMFVLNRGNIAQNIIGLSAKKLSPFFLYQLLKYRKNEILQLDIGGVQPSLKVPHLLSLIIQIPPTKIQNRFNNQVLEFVNKMEINYKQIQSLEKLRDTLLPKLMSGEVRVR
ncbi:restriction endonuclease subunit S [Methanococcoides sp. SA1]|nr:restriction endonuclease subunit S [Methanococcoides sp. SA1]